MKGRKTNLFTTKIHPGSKEYVDAVLSSGWLETGPFTDEFEKQFKKRNKTHWKPLLVTSGTAALHMAYELASRGMFMRGWYTTPNTFVATNTALLQAGLYPLWVDIDLNTGNMDLDKLAEMQLETHGIGVTVVHYGGMPVNLDRLYQIALDSSLITIEDAAHAVTAQYRGHPIGSNGTYICFSLNAKKPLPSGDGGILVCPSSEYELAKDMRWFGINKSTWERATEKGYKWEYDVKALGFKYNPTDFVAALALGELEVLGAAHAYRRFLTHAYRNRLEDVPGVTLLDDPEWAESGCHLMVIRVENRAGLIEKLNEKGIEVGMHYMPNNMYSVFNGSEKVAREETPNAWIWGQTALTLPLHLDLTVDDVQLICALIKEGW